MSGSSSEHFGALEDLCYLANETVRAAESGCTRYIGLEHVESGRFFLKNYSDPQTFKSTAHKFQKGDILYGKLRPYLDKAVFAAAPGVCSTELLVLRPKNPADAGFILSVIHSRDFIDYAQSSADKQYPRTSWNWISKFPTRLPDDIERSRIGSLLWKIQQAIEVESDLIRVSRELKAAVMNQLFTKGLRGEPQRETEIGLVPNSWKVKPLRELAIVKGGKRLPKGRSLSDLKTPFPYVRVTDLRDCSVLVNQLKFVPPEIQPIISRYIINPEDIYISIAGSIGLVGMVPEELRGANLTENAARIILSTSLPTRFVMWFLDSARGQRQISAATTKNAQPKLALTRIESLLIPVPNNDEAAEIGAMLDKLIDQIFVREHKLEILKDLFQAMLAKLMSAEIRITDLDIKLDSPSIQAQGAAAA